MAITLDTKTSGYSASTNALTWNHTNAGNLLVVAAEDAQGRSVTGVTYGGDALTQAVTATNGNNKVYIYFLANPKTGANNVVVSWSTTNDSYASAASFYGALGTKGATNTKTGTAQNKSITVTPTGKSSVLISSIADAGGNNVPSGTGQILISASGGNRVADYDILSEQLGVEQTQSWTSNGSQAYAMVVAEFLAAPPPAGSPMFFSSGGLTLG